MAVLGYISVSLINATDELITGIVILLSSDSITLIYRLNVSLSQNLNMMPLNQALVLYNAFLSDS